MKIESKDILSFNFYTYGQAYTGSKDGMRYRIKMDKREHELPPDAAEGDKPPVEKYFSVAIWPEPLAYDITEESKIVKTEYPFTEESYKAIIDYLNEKLPEYAEYELQTAKVARMKAEGIKNGQ